MKTLHETRILKRKPVAGRTDRKWSKGNNLLLLFSHSVMSSSLQPHGLQHTRIPCPSPSPGACSNSCPLSWWWTGRPGMLQSTGSQRVGHDWVTELNWTDRYSKILWKIFGSYANEIFNNWFWRLCHSGLIWVFLPNFCSLVLSQKKCDLILRR